MIKNILFDFGGVMIFVKKAPVLSVEEKAGLNAGEIMDKIKLSCIIPFAEGKITSKGFKDSLINSVGSDLGSDLFDSWNDRSLVSLNMDMIELVDSLKDKGYNCCLLSDTNEIHKNENEKEGRYNIFDKDKRILSCNIGISKATDVIDGTTRFFDYALKTLNIKANESIFIDDLQDNCDIANKIGIKTILAKNPQQVISDLSGILGID